MYHSDGVIRQLRYSNPAYYQVLYAQELEMMCFLVEPLFIKAGVKYSWWISEEDLSDAIIKMVR